MGDFSWWNVCTFTIECFWFCIKYHLQKFQNVLTSTSRKKEWSDTWEILHDGHIGPSRLPNQPPAGGVCEAPHHNLPARKNTQVKGLINRSTNSKIIPKIKKHNNFSVHDCFYLEASEVHFYWLHNDPVPNGRLHMHLRSSGWTMIIALACPWCPICHFSFQEGAPLLRPLYALLLSPHWGELHGRLRPNSQSGITPQKCGLRGRLWGFLGCDLGWGQWAFNQYRIQSNSNKLPDINHVLFNLLMALHTLNY